MIVHLYSPKGGQGCSVAAALMLLGSTDSLLVDMAPHSDQPAILGFQTPEFWDEAEWVDIKSNRVIRLHDGAVLEFLDEYQHIIVDHSLWTPEMSATWHADEHRLFMVVRNDYLSLRRAVAHPQRADGIILVSEPDRALQRADVEAALGAPVLHEIPIDPRLARAIDAGLLVSRPPSASQRLADDIMQGATP